MLRDMTHIVAWRKCVRGVWDLLAPTYSKFVTSLCGLPQLKVELACRCVKFIAALIKLSSMLLSMLSFFKDCILPLDGTRTTVSPWLMLLSLTL